jgi:hypothetical protein
MRALIGAGCLLLSWVGGAANAGDDVSQSEPTKSCREEVWRVYTPSNGGPKATWLPRSQKRTVLICDKQAFAQIQEQVSSASSDRDNQ